MSRYLLNRIGSCRLFPVSQNALSFSAIHVQTRSFAAEQAAKRPIPQAEKGITVESFLAAIGRGAAEKVNVTEWKEFWSMDRRALKAAGLEVRDRRYILWCMEKYRQGLDPRTFAYPPTPKKKIRGHGPAVQNGKRIRSRRRR